MRATATGVVARLNLFYSAVCRDGAYKCTLKFSAKVLLFGKLCKFFGKKSRKSAILWFKHKKRDLTFEVSYTIL